jgi:hypothetical protein
VVLGIPGDWAATKSPSMQKGQRKAGWPPPPRRFVRQVGLIARPTVVAKGGPSSTAVGLASRWVVCDLCHHQAVLSVEAWPGAAHCHCCPVKLSPVGRSGQFGPANAPMMPQLVHTMRGPNHGTGTSSGWCGFWRIGIVRSSWPTVDAIAVISKYHQQDQQPDYRLSRERTPARPRVPPSQETFHSITSSARSKSEGEP